MLKVTPHHDIKNDKDTFIIYYKLQIDYDIKIISLSMAKENDMIVYMNYSIDSLPQKFLELSAYVISMSFFNGIRLTPKSHHICYPLLSSLNNIKKEVEYLIDCYMRYADIKRD